MKRTPLLSIAVAILAATLRPFPSSAAGPIEIDAILSLTGPSSFIGTSEQQSLGVVEKIVNTHNGINGTLVKFVVQDDASNPQTTLQLVNGLIAKHTPVIIGPSYTSGCSAIAPALERAGPVQYCLSPGIHAAPGGYVFSAGAGTDVTAAAELRYFRERGFTRFAMLALTDASGQDHEEQVTAAMKLPENKNLQLVATEHFNPSDVTTSAQVSRIKAAQPQALITTATGVAFGTALRGLNDAGLDIPTTASAGNMSVKQMDQYKSIVPNELLYMATHGVAPDPSLTGAMRDAQNLYFTGLQADNVPPSYLASLIWDPAFIVVDALRHVGANATPAQLQHYLTTLHGFNGINGRYDFRGSQRGIGVNSVVTYRWDGTEHKFTIAPRPVGRR
jgi:branched-chain amino acid transport system substrate-binding protein